MTLSKTTGLAMGLFLIFILLTPLTAKGSAEQGSPAASSPAESGAPPKGQPPGNPPRDMPGGQGGPMAAAELEEKDSSDYFTDLDGNTSSINAYVDYLYEKGLINDTAGDGLFRADKAVTRGELATFLYNKYSYSKEGFSYGDVPTDSYCYQAVMRGKASGIFDDTKYFYPDEAATREEAVLWIYRSELSSGMPPEMSSGDVSAYGDGNSLSDEVKSALGTLSSMNFFSPDGEGLFQGSDPMTRGDLVMILYRLSFLGGAPGGMGGPGMPGGGSGTVDHGTAANSVGEDVSGTVFTSTGDRENALRVEQAEPVTLQNITINKTGGEAAEGDTSNFYGSNAAFLALDGAQVTIRNSTVNSTADGGNGIYSYGDGTSVTVRKTVIRTSGNNSGGVMVTGGGAMDVYDCDIETQGRSSASLRTDRGGGTLAVDGGTYRASGEGSPAVYCTAQIAVSNAVLEATASEAAVVEGKNSLTLTDCDLTGNMQKNNVENLQNVMIYQSMSGDADTGKSSFTMTGGSLTSHSGDMIYVTNTSCEIELSRVELSLSNDVLLRVAGNDARNGWGVAGSNGGQCVFTAEDQSLAGKIIVDEISSLSLTLADGTRFTGSVNSVSEGGEVALTLDASSIWELTGDSRVSSLTGATDRIVTNGYTLYVDGKAFN